MAKDYEIISSQPWSYLDETNRLINGFRVFVRLVAFDEVYEINTPSLVLDVVKAKVQTLVKQRNDLTTL